MGLWSFITGKGTAASELAQMMDFDMVAETQDRVYLKELALTTVVEYVANTMAQTQYEIEPEDNNLLYTLGVKPNVNQSGADLLKELTRKLLLDSEALIIKTDDDQFLLADDFERVEYAMVDDIFKQVTVKDYVFSRSFARRDVIYINYMNKELQELATSLLGDYGELFGRIVETQKRKNQLRASISIDSNSIDLNAESQVRLQAVVDRIYKRISTRSVALIPEQKGIKYTELSKQTASGSTDGIAEMVKVAESYLEQMARAAGVPPILLLGGQAETGTAHKNFFAHCIDPLVHAISTEFNRQLWTKEEHMQGNRIHMRRVTGRDLFDLSGAIDKLVGASIATPNELRKEAGLPQSTDPNLDKFYLTMNYAPTGGGEENAEDTTD